MPRIPPSMVKKPRLGSTSDDHADDGEHQGWVRVVFGVISALSLVAMMNVLGIVLKSRDVQGLLLMWVLSLISAIFATWAAPRRLHRRLMRKLMLAIVLSELFVSLLIVFK